jgi:succinate dehydrogenase / fumarate reductase, cytochrome b subunit
MNSTSDRPTAGRFYQWFDIRKRDAGSWGFALNRITALGLTFYLFLHLIVLGQLAVGPDAYDNFLALIHNPVFVFGELLVVIAGIYHGLNGLRIVLTSFGIGVSSQKGLFYMVLVVTAILSLMFALRMFAAG